MNRRGFLGALLGAAAAPLVPKSIFGALLPVSEVPALGAGIVFADEYLLSRDEFYRRMLEPAIRALMEAIDRDILAALQ